MTVTWAIELDGDPAERVRADLLVAPFFEGARPLRGAASRVDWRLCGHLSELLARGAFRGAAGELVLVPTGARLRAPRALLVGLGPRDGFGPRTLRAAARSAVERAAALRAGVVALALPSEGESGLVPEQAAGAALIGAGEALEKQPFALRLHLLVEPGGAARARAALADLVARIELPGVVTRLAAEPRSPSAPSRPGPSVPPAGNQVGVGDAPPSAPRPARPSSAKSPSLP